MQSKQRSYRFALVVAAITLLAGCASAPPGPQITFDQLQNPDMTPREKWSDAMVYMEAMRVWGMRDVPREMMNSAATIQNEKGEVQGVLDAPTVTMTAVAPPSGMSSGAALGLGVGLMLLTTPPIQSAKLPQVAAWVPADLASSPEEAAKLAERTFHEAREKVFIKRLPQEIFTTAYANGDSRVFGKKFPKSSNLVMFDSAAKPSPSFVSSQTSYGPIFMYGNKIAQEVTLNAPGLGNIAGARDRLSELSAELPEWFVIYDTEKSFSKSNKAPPVVLHNGEAHYFIGK